MTECKYCNQDAIALFEGNIPPAGSFRYPACNDHAPNAPPIRWIGDQLITDGGRQKDSETPIDDQDEEILGYRGVTSGFISPLFCVDCGEEANREVEALYESDFADYKTGECSLCEARFYGEDTVMAALQDAPLDNGELAMFGAEFKEDYSGLSFGDYIQAMEVTDGRICLEVDLPDGPPAYYGLVDDVLMYHPGRLGVVGKTDSRGKLSWQLGLDSEIAPVRREETPFAESCPETPNPKSPYELAALKRGRPSDGCSCGICNCQSHTYSDDDLCIWCRNGDHSEPPE